jgi:hypothetical protein
VAGHDDLLPLLRLDYYSLRSPGSTRRRTGPATTHQDAANAGEIALRYAMAKTNFKKRKKRDVNRGANKTSRTTRTPWRMRPPFFALPPDVVVLLLHFPAHVARAALENIPPVFAAVNRGRSVAAGNVLQYPTADPEQCLS